MHAFRRRSTGALLGVCEVVVGGWVLVAGASLASACMAVLYATFAGFDEHQRRRGAGCSCFGASAATATAALTLTLTAASELADAVSKVWPRGGT